MGFCSLERFELSFCNTLMNYLCNQIFLRAICYCRSLFQGGRTSCWPHWWEYPSVLESPPLGISSAAAFLRSYLQKIRRTLHGFQLLFSPEMFYNATLSIQPLWRMLKTPPCSLSVLPSTQIFKGFKLGVCSLQISRIISEGSRPETSRTITCDGVSGVEWSCAHHVNPKKQNITDCHSHQEVNWQSNCPVSEEKFTQST